MGATTFLARSRRAGGAVGSDGPDGGAPFPVGAPDDAATGARRGRRRRRSAGDPAVAGPSRSARGVTRQWTLAPDAVASMPDPGVQDLWLAMRRASWRSVAVVPTWRGASELGLAEQLVVVGVADTRRPVTLVSARGISVSEAEDVLAMVRAAMLRAELVVVVTDALVDNPATAAVVRSLDAVVLTVRMGVSSVTEVDRTVAAASPAEVIGVVTRA